MSQDSANVGVDGNIENLALQEQFAAEEAAAGAIQRGEPNPRRGRRLEHPGVWDYDKEMSTIMSLHRMALDKAGSEADIDTAAVVNQCLAKEAAHVRRVEAYREEADRRAEEERKKEADHAKEKMEAEHAEGTSDVVVYSDANPSVKIGDAYLLHTYFTIDNTDEARFIKGWQNIGREIVESICPQMRCKYNDKPESRFVHHKGYYDLLFESSVYLGSSFYRSMKDRKLGEAKKAADMWFINYVTLVLALIKGDTHWNARALYTAYHNATKQPKYTPGTPLALHYAAVSNHLSGVFALARERYTPKEVAAARVANETQGVRTHSVPKKINHIAGEARKAVENPLGGAPNAGGHQ